MNTIMGISTQSDQEQYLVQCSEGRNLDKSSFLRTAFMFKILVCLTEASSTVRCRMFDTFIE